MVGGAIGLLKEGDEIEVDVAKRSINVLLSDKELEARRKAWKAPVRDDVPVVMAKYAKLVKQADDGAVTLL
jgi:dihydroxy-acid dehydratase